MKKKVTIPITEYHFNPALGSSGIRLLNQRPSLFKCQVIDGHTEPRRCFELGTAFHSLVLEPDQFAKTHVVTDLDKRTKEFKDFATQNTGKTILKDADYAIVKGMRDGIARNTAASKLIKGLVEVEMSYFWTDEATKVECKCRPDALVKPHGRTAIIDLKSTSDASPRAFQRSVVQFGYHTQAAWYVHGVKQVDNIEALLFVFIVCETSPPYDCAVYYLSDEAMAQGWSECQAALNVYVECKKTNTWPGYPDGLVELTLPKWYNQPEQGDNTWN